MSLLFEYDAAGRRTAVIDALGNRHTFEYDADGNRIREIDANGNVTEYEYNDLGQKVLTRFDDGHTLIDEVDVMGRRTAQVDQAGTRTEYGYDGLGRFTEVRQFLEGETLTTSYTCDSQGNKLTQTDAEGRTTRWTYDSMGRVLTRTLPMGQVETFAYDANGNPISHTDFKGQVTTRDFDSQNRLTRQTYADGTVESWVYDSAGQKIEAQQVINGDVRVTQYDYDQRGRLIRETKPNGAILDYGYDAAGNRTRLTTTQANGDSRTVDYTFDALSRLSTVTDDTGTTTYGYDAAGNRASLTRPNGVETTYTYDGVNRLTRQVIKDQAGNILASYTYSLSPTGRRTGIEEHNGRVTEYNHDGLYRLTGETVTDPVNPDYTATFEYDKVGNRTYSTIDGVQTAYTYDDNDRLTQAGGITYTYDANGNTLTETEDGEITTYTYDARNKLVSREDASVLARYGYDIHGIRSSKTENGVTTNYVVDHNRQYAQVLAESSNGATSKQYTYGDDLLSQSITANGQHSFYLYDGLGSTRALTDSSGSVTDRYDYDAFGELRNQTGNTDNDYLYTGEQFDPNLGQYYLRARYYNQEVGRFTQMDTWMGNNHDPVTLHKYLYANADPGNMVDPTGRFSIGSVMTGVNIAGRLHTAATVSYGLFQIATGEQEFSASDAGAFILWSLVGSKAPGLLKPVQKFLQKSGCLKNSFAEGTLVKTENGLVAIQDIQIGDLVLSFNEKTGENELKEVSHIIAGDELKEVLSIELSNGSLIQSTPEHLFYFNGVWDKAENIQEGQKLYNLGEEISVVSVSKNQERVKVYNLTVADNHNYYVGEEEILVHNISPCEKAAQAIAKNVKGKRLCVKATRSPFVGSIKNGQISKNENHFAVQVGEMVFDNLNPDGIPFSEWADDIGIYDGIGVNLSEENMTGNRGGCIK
ncbi:MAG: polymorphic toxin-type HINT domain-containing protein [Pseudomonadota bacterium]|nr:polymorphic toxin-type HINT domain-containing protein [Pseudomonadota bacterium]MEE3319266.1 polymorphic toxin-type HINT domain-containing protein [Pseudomonadota bacterium]